MCVAVAAFTTRTAKAIKALVTLEVEAYDVHNSPPLQAFEVFARSLRAGRLLHAGRHLSQPDARRVLGLSTAGPSTAVADRPLLRRERPVLSLGGVSGEGRRLPDAAQRAGLQRS